LFTLPCIYTFSANMSSLGSDKTYFDLRYLGMIIRKRKHLIAQVWQPNYDLNNHSWEQTVWTLVFLNFLIYQMHFLCSQFTSWLHFQLFVFKTVFLAKAIKRKPMLIYFRCILSFILAELKCILNFIEAKLKDYLRPKQLPQVFLKF